MVIPAQAGIQDSKIPDTGLRRYDKIIIAFY
jgi:hypothetical protein